MKVLVIREDQLDKFAEYLSVDFERAIIGHIRTAYPARFAVWEKRRLPLSLSAT